MFDNLRYSYILLAASSVLLSQNLQPTSALSASSFSARGLPDEAVLMRFFTGDFVNIDLNRDDQKFQILFQQYLEAYGRKCELPPDRRVPIMTQECARWDTETSNIRNGRGLIISSSSRQVCGSYRSVPTGLFAKPALYDARNSLSRLQAMDAGRQMSQIMGQVTQADPLAPLGKMLADAQTLKTEMASLVASNGCQSPGLQRFEENVRLFALNKPAIRLDGTSYAANTNAPGTPFKDQNYTKLITDLVEDDATKWGAMAAFVHGSISASTVSSRDGAGRPTKVTAPYAWKNFFGLQRSSLTLTFTDGSPECLTYAETPSVCHAPNRKIVAGYAEGFYSQ